MEKKYVLRKDLKIFQQYSGLEQSYINMYLTFSTERFYEVWIKPEDAKAGKIYKNFMPDMSYDVQAVENTRNIILSEHTNNLKQNLMYLENKTNELLSCLEDEIIALEVDKEIYGFGDDEGTEETEENDTEGVS